TLDNVLVGTPVPQTNNGRAEQHAKPGIVVVEVPRHPPRLAYRRPGRLHTLGYHGFPEVEHFGTADLAQLIPAAQGLKTEDGDHERSNNQDHSLQGLCICYRPETSDDSIDTGQQYNQDGAKPEAVQAEEVHIGKQHAEYNPTGENTYRDLRQHIGNQ